MDAAGLTALQTEKDPLLFLTSFSQHLLNCAQALASQKWLPNVEDAKICFLSTGTKPGHCKQQTRTRVLEKSCVCHTSECGPVHQIFVRSCRGNPKVLRRLMRLACEGPSGELLFALEMSGVIGMRTYTDVSLISVPY